MTLSCDVALTWELQCIVWNKLVNHTASTKIDRGQGGKSENPVFLSDSWDRQSHN